MGKPCEAQMVDYIVGFVLQNAGNPAFQPGAADLSRL